MATSKANSDEESLAHLERGFLELDESADGSSRTEMWEQMAALHTKLGNQRDATLSWTRALWEADGDRAQSVAQDWAKAEEQIVGELHRSYPGSKQLRLLIATWVAETTAGQGAQRHAPRSNRKACRSAR